MEKNFEETIEMPQKLKDHVEGYRDLTDKELIGGPIEDEKEIIDPLSEIYNVDQIVSFIKKEYNIEVKQGFVDMIRGDFERKVNTPDYSRKQAVRETIEKLLDRMKVGTENNPEISMADVKRSYRNAESLLLKFKNGLVEYNEVKTAIKEAKEKTELSG
ncbi:MAG: hypothetical protein Q7T50_02970, partial [Candidatus Magasanikbacteria bacterium]|nr:hypothetical protein [Candidatus Magasanikbacteria bacterium]